MVAIILASTQGAAQSCNAAAGWECDLVYDGTPDGPFGVGVSVRAIGLDVQSFQNGQPRFALDHLHQTIHVAWAEVDAHDRDPSDGDIWWARRVFDACR